MKNKNKFFTESRLIFFRLLEGQQAPTGSQQEMNLKNKIEQLGKKFDEMEKIEQIKGVTDDELIKVWDGLHVLADEIKELKNDPAMNGLGLRRTYEIEDEIETLERAVGELKSFMRPLGVIEESEKMELLSSFELTSLENFMPEKGWVDAFITLPYDKQKTVLQSILSHGNYFSSLPDPSEGGAPYAYIWQNNPKIEEFWQYFYNEHSSQGKDTSYDWASFIDKYSLR